MINMLSLIQVKAFARQDGLWLSLMWVVSFLLMVYLPGSSWGSLLAMATPLMVLWLLTRFRNYALEGGISFRRALAYSCYTFFYASMIFCLVQFVFFRFLDNGSFLAMLQQGVEQMEALYKQQGTSDELLQSMKQGVELVGMMSPIELAFIFMMQNLFIGGVLSLPIALLGKQKRR